MAKSLSVFGGASGLGKFVIQNLAGVYSDIHLADPYPFRQSVYALQASVTGTKIHKHPTFHKANFKTAGEASDHLVYITHDYFKLAHSKNFFLERFQSLAKGKERVVVVLPIEYDLEDNSELVAKFQEKIPNALILKVNLTFGGYNSYLLQHTLQYLFTPSVLVSTGGQTKFQPIQAEAVANVIKKGLSEGTNGYFHLAGEQTLTHKEIVDILAKHLGVANPDLASGWHSFGYSLHQNKIFADLFLNSQTRGMYNLLSKSNTLSAGEKTLADLGVQSGKLADSFVQGKASKIEEKAWNKVCVD